MKKSDIENFVVEIVDSMEDWVPVPKHESIVVGIDFANGKSETWIEHPDGTRIRVK